MTSRAYVWIYLAGDGAPTLCGAFDHQQTSAGVQVGTFVYGKSYLANPDAIALDPVALPLSPRTFSTTALSGAFGPLADATPDDWGRYVIDKRFGRQVYPIGYMLHPLDDAIGNIAFSSDTKQPPPDNEPLDASDIPAARQVLLGLEQGNEIPAEIFNRIRPNTAMGGARPKLTVQHEGELWLAKFPSAKDEPSLAYAPIEAAMLDLGALCDIGPSVAKVVHGDVLLVKRFDRARIAQGWRRDGFLSARSIFYANQSNLPVGYSGSYGRLANELVRYSAHASADRELLFRRMVFNVFISNTDDHDRNHGLLAGDLPGEYRLSPAYDMIPRIHGTARKYHALSLGAGSALATRENLVHDHREFGLSESQACAIIDSVHETVARHWHDCLIGQGVSSEGIQRLGKCFCAVPMSERSLRDEIRRNAIGTERKTAPRG